MSYYLAGLAATELAEDVRGAARGVLVALATFVPDKGRREPVCFASQASIAARAGFGVTAVAGALAAHEAAGLIVRDGTVTRRGTITTVRWSLPFLAELAAADEARRKDRRRAARSGST